MTQVRTFVNPNPLDLADDINAFYSESTTIILIASSISYDGVNYVGLCTEQVIA